MDQYKKYVVVSSNNNPDYLFYLPYVEKAWAKYGWDLCVILTNDVDISKIDKRREETIIVQLPKIEGLRMETIAQSSRLYAANYLPMDALIMTSDMDLLPLSDYWHPNIDEITIYGHDLTDYSYFPMGYVAMSGANWFKWLQCTYDTSRDMLRDAMETGLPYAPEWENWWNHDWTILTRRLKPAPTRHILRQRRLTGTYAYGRVDRGDGMKIPPNETLIDAHCENISTQHEDKLPKFLSLFNSIHGEL